MNCFSSAFISLIYSRRTIQRRRTRSIKCRFSNTPIYYYSHAAWQFAHGNAKVAREWIDRGNWVFPPARTRNYADVFYDLGWLTRPGAPAAAQSSDHADHFEHAGRTDRHDCAAGTAHFATAKAGRKSGRWIRSCPSKVRRSE